MAQNIDAEMAEENFRQSATGDASRCFPGAGAFQDVPCVGVVVFERTCEVGVTGTGPGDTPFCGGIAQNLPGGHDFFPVRPVTVFDHHGDRAADSLSVSHAGEKTNLVLLDFHPSTPAIPALPPL